MGLSYHNVAFLARAKQQGVCFNTIGTIGRQILGPSQRQIEQLAQRYGITLGGATFQDSVCQEYADRFLQVFLDAQEVKSLDYSDYERCDIMADMNKPIGHEYHERFDVVIDGGSLEHIFNVPVALANEMSMVKRGGSLFLFTKANNQMGHGFYQFGPDLFFRVFDPANGFVLRDLFLVEHPFLSEEFSPRGVTCYAVTDPAVARTRIYLVSKRPVSVMLHAIRTDVRPLFETTPLQSDYAALYTTGGEQDFIQGTAFAAGDQLKLMAKRLLHASLISTLWPWRQLFAATFSNTRFYQRVHLW
jgi:SAM-dependent methyltransferase